ncbi:radical SAM protein (plasmid) [Alicyclobacillus sp. TC]|uniref:Heme chaperone HemW n=1 Tax=Alicyclobacillus tolerans TaxID=90970 RepID=A0ABT9LYY3_9BACL|nr:MULTISPECIES: radical SAM protein [Alicyclobacillus]MDP9729351.1 oxygen-independent coproporphyrinogen-3 oxidase [Alicyclobacillus tengchongensis]QRF24851.1 radical SAM protein [Alicyclobacillus sp. TC]
MKLLNDSVMAFDFRLPIYNWFFPFSYQGISDRTRDMVGSNSLDIFKVAGMDPKFRALYFHVPFCEAICTFCPFSRVVCTDEEVFEHYTNALIKEIQIKSRYPNVSSYPIDAIFFGGGTPSILNPSQIRRIGKTIKECFDLSQLKEFSYECHLTTVTEDRLEALNDIGVTHGRMGVQTFNPLYRKLFNLVEDTDLIREKVSLLKKAFPFVSIDILYGMHGQTFDEFVQDLHYAVELQTPTIDVYPINNAVTQIHLNREFRENNLEATSGFSKTLMNVILREYMEKSGYLPHNGHGYVKSSKEHIEQRPVVTDTYRFQYHEAHYGYKGHEIIGFGSGAWSVMDGFILENKGDWKSYVSTMRDHNQLEMNFFEFDPVICESKGIAFHLPYHGEVEKKKINFELVRPEVLGRLQEVINRGLVYDDGTHYRLSELGWIWYGNLLYYLSPDTEQKAILNFIERRSQQKGRYVEDWDISFDFNREVIIA